MFTVESTNFAEAERKRLEYLRQLEHSIPGVVEETEKR